MAKEKRTKLSAHQFLAAINLDPAWLGNQEWIEVLDFVDFGALKPQAQKSMGPLDKVLFSGKNHEGWSVDISYSQVPKFSGVVAGGLKATAAHLETTKGLIVLGAGSDGLSANFCGCKKLAVAEGRFARKVSYKDAGVTSVGEIEVGQATRGIKLDFSGCPLNCLPKRIDTSQVLAPKRALMAHALASTQTSGPEIAI